MNDLLGLNSKPGQSTKPLTKIDKKMNEIGEWINEPNDTNSKLICLIYGVDGTSKTGIAMQYLKENKKRTLYVDIDGNSIGLWNAHYQDCDFIKIKNPQEIKARIDKDTGEVTADIDYIATFFKIKLALLWIRQNIDDYDAIVIDGISTLIFYAEQQMRLDNHIQADGQVRYDYWNGRNVKFLNLIEFVKGLHGIDKIFIGHDDFINIPGSKISTSKSGKKLKLDNTTKLVQKTNRVMDQRIHMELIIDENNNDLFENYATIHKSRAKSEAVFNKYLISKKTKNGFKWYSENVKKMFDDLKKENE